MRVIWNISHREFTISDFYYFSKLENYLKIRFEVIENAEPLESINEEGNSILVINYPEVPFTEKEKQSVSEFVKYGGRLIVAAYYQDEDRVAEVCADLISFSGAKFNTDSIFHPEEYLLTTAETTREFRKRFQNAGFRTVYFPCSCSIEGSNILPVLSIEGKTCAAYVPFGEGEIIALGTAVFWDNFAIDRQDNWKFVDWLFNI